jgi:hypothetical protein
MLFTFNFWMFEMSENQKESKALPALYVPQLGMYLLRKSEMLLLEQIALNNSATFRLSQLSRYVRVGEHWDYEAVKTIMSEGIIKRVKYDIFWCDLNHVRQIALKLEDINYYGTGTTEMPLIRLAKNVIDNGDRLLIPKSVGPNADDVKYTYITNLMKSPKAIDLFTHFRHHFDRYVIVKPRAKEILGVFGEIDSLIRVSMKNKELSDKKSSIQDVWRTNTSSQT